MGADRTSGSVRLSAADTARRLGAALLVVVTLVAVDWILAAVDFASDHRLLRWGITPREPDELPDVFTAPFLHTGAAHLTANTVPLFLFGVLAALRGIGRFVVVSLIVIVCSGLGVWLTAPPHSNTVGASGLIFGYFGYVLVRGFLDRRPVDIAVGLVIGLLYGSILWGVLPNQPGISWQAHLFGLVGGFLAAWMVRRRRD